MTDINVDDFFKDSARTLVALYGVFPRRIAIFVEDIYGPEEPDEFGMHSDRHRACFGTLLWLGEEGYLRFEEPIKDEAIDQAVLSGSCFTLLSSPTSQPLEEAPNDLPDQIRAEHSTHVHRIKTALKERSSSLLRAAMIELMTQIESRR